VILVIVDVLISLSLLIANRTFDLCHKTKLEDFRHLFGCSTIGGSDNFCYTLDNAFGGIRKL
jgi:hypothetical protein